MALDVRTLISTVETTLFNVLNLGYATRYPAAATIAALRAAPVQTVKDAGLIYVTDQANLYQWSAVSTAADDGALVIQPTTPPLPAQVNGRWLRVANYATFGPNKNAPLQSKQTGYCRQVVLFQGDQDMDSVLTTLWGQTPSMAIQWIGDGPRARSIRPGALYWDNLDFQVLVCSSCLRPPPWAFLGSPLAGELAKDPGLNRMIGDVRYILAGIETGVSGIDSIEIRNADIVDVEWDQRVFMASVHIVVRTSWTIPDEDLEDMAIQVEEQFPWTHEGADAFDPLNYVARGYTVQVGPGLTRSYPAGSAFIAGAVVSSTSPDKTFTASRDTYRDLKPDGTLTYVEVAVGAKSPAVTTGAMRVGVTRTDSTKIIADKVLCSYAVQWGTMNLP